MASNITVKRQLITTTADFTSNLGINPVVVVADDQYIPLTVDLAQTDITALVIPIATQSKLVATVVGAFDKVRVGDFVSSVATGSLTAKSDGTITGAYLVSGLKYFVYPATYNSSTLEVKAGDVVTVASAGTGIPANTTVLKIDHGTRQVWIDKALTESKVADITVTKKIRVTAVRKSTATSNPNEIDFDSTVATTGTSGLVTIKGGATSGVVAVFKLTPIDSTNGIAKVNIGQSVLTGDKVIGTPDGLNNIVVQNLVYTSLGIVSFDLDKFLLTAGVVAPTS